MNTSILNNNESMLSVAMANKLDYFYNLVFSKYYINALFCTKKSLILKMRKAYLYKKDIVITIAKSQFANTYNVNMETLNLINSYVDNTDAEIKVMVDKNIVPGISSYLAKAKGHDMLSSRTNIVISWK